MEEMGYAVGDTLVIRLLNGMKIEGVIERFEKDYVLIDETRALGDMVAVPYAEVESYERLGR